MDKTTLIKKMITLIKNIIFLFKYDLNKCFENHEEEIDELINKTQKLTKWLKKLQNNI